MSSAEVYSPGLEGVIAGETAISTITGGLSYRGYLVTELAAQCSFEEVAHLLLHGELPTVAELAAFRKSGPSSVELERAQNGTETGMIEGLQRLGGFGGVADRLNEYNHYLGNPGYFPEDLHRYQSATTGSIRTFAQAQLKPTARVVARRNIRIPPVPDARIAILWRSPRSMPTPCGRNANIAIA